MEAANPHTMRKQFFVEYESDKYNRGMWNRQTNDYGCNVWDAGNASTIRSAKSIIRNIRKNHAEDNPRNFKVYDSFADVETETEFVPCVYSEA